MYQIELVRNDTGRRFDEFVREKEWLATIFKCAERMMTQTARIELGEGFLGRSPIFLLSGDHLSLENALGYSTTEDSHGEQ